MLEKLLDDVGAAKILKVSPQTLRNWRCQRRGPAYIRVGRLVRYKPEDLAEFLNAARVDPEAPSGLQGPKNCCGRSSCSSDKSRKGNEPC